MNNKKQKHVLRKNNEICFAFSVYVCPSHLWMLWISLHLQLHQTRQEKHRGYLETKTLWHFDRHPPNIFRNHVTHIHVLLFFQQIIGHPTSRLFSIIFGERNLQFDAVLCPGSFRGNRHVSIDGDCNQMTHLNTWSLRGSQILKSLELDDCSFAGIWLSGWNTLFFQCPTWRWGNRLQRQ